MALFVAAWSVCTVFFIAFMMGASRKDNEWRENK